ncbi:TonB-dependent receptor plug domain-containing protein [uncultured Draconibacterium sp.]|uniref:TonB-dependent receptor plug domain-containing protein n=1 Tax=uncultured Draconibacterium sp. TaxID=1573823 RepID=UPI00325FFD57
MKNLNFNHFIIIVLLGLLPVLSKSQERTIKGLVTTFDNIPLINVEVKVLSSKQITLTDTLGRFEVPCAENDKLKVSAKGFVSRKVKIDEKAKLALVNLSFKSGIKNVEIAAGYGHISDRDKLFAVSSLQNKQDNFSDYSNMYDLIRGMSAGIEVVGKEITIRGEHSINSSSVLIVVDGVVRDSDELDRLMPYDVKSIDILKDGAAAIYGSRGAAGVILITTKKGGD